MVEYDFEYRLRPKHNAERKPTAPQRIWCQAPRLWLSSRTVAAVFKRHKTIKQNRCSQKAPKWRRISTACHVVAEDRQGIVSVSITRMVEGSSPGFAMRTDRYSGASPMPDLLRWWRRNSSGHIFIVIHLAVLELYVFFILYKLYSKALCSPIAKSIVVPLQINFPERHLELPPLRERHFGWEKAELRRQ